MQKRKNTAAVKQFKARAKELVAQMTLREKIYQMLNDAPAIERLNIKAYNWWNEALHGVARAGVATIFPQAIGLAATFDTELMREVADHISTEGRAKFNMQQKYGDTDIYKGLTFWSPNVNIFRDPRWGRGHETYGEDPYLTARLGVAFIDGLQGDDEKYLKTAACAKHFAVHSGPEDIRHEFDAIATKQDMYETYLPAFKACVQEAEVEAVMGAYNRTNGEPCCGSKTLLADILRGDWGFDGHVTSDCWAIKDFHKFHKVTKTPAESVAMAVNNGCDTNCGTMFAYLTEAVEQGLVSEETIDQSVERLYTTKMKLGIFDEGTPWDDIPYSIVDDENARALNKKASEASLVLLRNDGILPLDKSKIGTIGVIGPNANNRRALVGNYEGTASRYVTVAEGLQDYAAQNGMKVRYSEGCPLFKDKAEELARANDRIAEAKAVCDESDVVVAVLGLDSGLEGEEGDQGNVYSSGDKKDLRLPGLQHSLIQTLYESGKPVILLVLAGSALDLSWESQYIPAILQCWYPGAEGGHAIASVLFGETSPQGKLPITLYRSTDDLPAFTDYSMKNRTYRYMRQEALYPFGYGLSYTDFDISDVRLSQSEIKEGESITITAKITNTGKMDGAETVQVYIKAPGENTPNAQLKAFQKVALAKGESRDVALILDDISFALYDEDAKHIVKQGEFTVYVGASQPDSRSLELINKAPFAATVTCAGQIQLKD